MFYFFSVASSHGNSLLNILDPRPPSSDLHYCPSPPFLCVISGSLLPLLEEFLVFFSSRMRKFTMPANGRAVQNSGQGPCQCGQNFTILLRIARQETVLDEVNSTSNPPKDIGACMHAQSCPAPSDLMDWSPLSSSVLPQGMFVP